MVTHTPIPWFLALPLDELAAWCGTVAGVQAEDSAPPGDG